MVIRDMKLVHQFVSNTAASMSCRGHFCLTSFFFWSVTFGLWSPSSCTVQSSATFDVNHELKDKTIHSDNALTLYDIEQPVTCALRCSEKFPCSFFFHNKADGACVLYRSPFMNINLTHAPGYTFFTMAEFPIITSDMETSQCPRDTVTRQEHWLKVSGGLTHVSVGPAGTWGVNRNRAIFYRVGTYGNLSAVGQRRYQVSGSLVQVDVGSDIMLGVNSKDKMYYRVGIASSPSGGDETGTHWIRIRDKSRWVSVSPAGSVWAVDTSGQLLHARDSATQLTTSTVWDVMATDMRRVDAGRAGVWALDNAGRLHHRRGTYGDDGGTSVGTGWVMLGGEFSFVSSGTNLVAVVTSAGCVWVRVGLSADTPTGSGWALYPGVMKQVEVYDDGPVAGLWAVDFSDNVYLSVLDKETGL